MTIFTDESERKEGKENSENFVVSGSAHVEKRFTGTIKPVKVVANISL